MIKDQPDQMPDMLPIDYAGMALAMIGVVISWRAAVYNDGVLMWVAAGVAGVGAALKLRGTRIKQRLEREQQPDNDAKSID